jgi:hypothetical protein
MAAMAAPGLGPLARFGLRLSLAQGVIAGLRQVKLLCARWLGVEALGLYSVALHLASLPAQRLSAVVNLVAYPPRPHGRVAGRVAAPVLKGSNWLSKAFDLG